MLRNSLILMLVHLALVLMLVHRALIFMLVHLTPPLSATEDSTLARDTGVDVFIRTSGH